MVCSYDRVGQFEAPRLISSLAQELQTYREPFRCRARPKNQGGQTRQVAGGGEDIDVGDPVGFQIADVDGDENGSLGC